MGTEADLRSPAVAIASDNTIVNVYFMWVKTADKREAIMEKMGINVNLELIDRFASIVNSSFLI